MVFAVLNARAVNARALEGREGGQQFVNLADSIASAVDTIRVPARPPRRAPSPANMPSNLDDDAMDLDSTLRTDEAESSTPIVVPSQGLRPAVGNSRLPSTLVPQYGDEEDSDADVPPVPSPDANTFAAIAGPSNLRIINAAPAIPERAIPKDSSEASHSGSDVEGDDDEVDQNGKPIKKRRLSREPPDMTEAVPDPYDEAGRPPVGEYSARVCSSPLTDFVRSTKLGRLGSRHARTLRRSPHLTIWCSRDGQPVGMASRIFGSIFHRPAP
jgi:hypothetical protein